MGSKTDGSKYSKEKSSLMCNLYYNINVDRKIIFNIVNYNIKESLFNISSIYVVCYNIRIIYVYAKHFCW